MIHDIIQVNHLSCISWEKYVNVGFYRVRDHGQMLYYMLWWCYYVNQSKFSLTFLAEWFVVILMICNHCGDDLLLALPLYLSPLSLSISLSLSLSRFLSIFLYLSLSPSLSLSLSLGTVCAFERIVLSIIPNIGNMLKLIYLLAMLQTYRWEFLLVEIFTTHHWSAMLIEVL